MKMTNPAKASNRTVKPGFAIGVRAPSLRRDVEGGAAAAAEAAARLRVPLRRRLAMALRWTRRSPHLSRSQRNLLPTKSRKCKKLRRCKALKTPRL